MVADLTTFDGGGWRVASYYFAFSLVANEMCLLLVPRQVTGNALKEGAYFDVILAHVSLEFLLPPAAPIRRINNSTRTPMYIFIRVLYIWSYRSGSAVLFFLSVRWPTPSASFIPITYYVPGVISSNVASDNIRIPTVVCPNHQ